MTGQFLSITRRSLRISDGEAARIINSLEFSDGNGGLYAKAPVPKIAGAITYRLAVVEGDREHPVPAFTEALRDAWREKLREYEQKRVMYPAEITIPREMFRKGVLLDADCKRCALGFLGHALGIPDEDMFMAGSILPKLRERGHIIFGSEAHLLLSIATTNDSLDDPRVREHELDLAFSWLGINLTFTGEYPASDL